jgi:predicted membrane channel-forming protein YqfA (hemolysin III family)
MIYYPNSAGGGMKELFRKVSFNSIRILIIAGLLTNLFARGLKPINFLYVLTYQNQGNISVIRHFSGVFLLFVTLGCLGLDFPNLSLMGICEHIKIRSTL